jgi:diaminopimelate decarboxylase
MLEPLKRAAKMFVVRRLLDEDRRRRAHLPAGFDGLHPPLWDCAINASGHLAMQGVDLVALARELGTPRHVVDHDRLVANYREFVGAFRKHLPKVELATSYKTNPLPGVLKALHAAGTWAEVISEFELWLALRLRVPPERIVLNGPGKGRNGIELGVSRGIGLINLDGPDEIPWVVASARRAGRRQPVGLRVVTSVGWASQFGTRIDNGEAFDAFAEMARHPELQPCALHVHLGTGIKDVGAYLQAVREVLACARELRERLGIRITCYDFGGGFAVPTVRSLDEWDGRMVALGLPARMALPEDCPGPKDYAEPIAGLVREFHPQPDDQPQILFEPGRAITSSAQVLLLRVMVAKRLRDGVPKLILDGGKNITMPLGWETHQLYAANKMNVPASQLYDLYGPLCHPGDIVARNKRMPAMEADDILAIMDAGAYFIPNQMNFSLPRPPVSMLRHGRIEEIRGAETFADIVRLDHVDTADA